MDDMGYLRIILLSCSRMVIFDGFSWGIAWYTCLLWIVGLHS